MSKLTQLTPEPSNSIATLLFSSSYTFPSFLLFFLTTQACSTLHLTLPPPPVPFDNHLTFTFGILTSVFITCIFSPLLPSKKQT